MNLRRLIDRMASLNLAQVQNETLAEQSELLAATIRQALSTSPGGPHDYPWRETGALSANIGSETDGLTAIVGSTDEVATFQEYGTATIPPRPFLAPIAEAGAPDAAHAVGERVVLALRSF